MNFTPSRVLKWYGGLPSWAKWFAVILLIVLIVASAAWFVLNKMFSVEPITHDSETTQVAISHIEKEHKEEKKEFLKQAEVLEREKKKEQHKRKELKKERKDEFKKAEKEHAAIDGVDSVDDIVDLFNKNRSKRKT